MKFDRIVLSWETGTGGVVHRQETITIMPEGGNIADFATRFNLYLRTLELVRDLIKEARSPMLGADV